MSDLDREEYPGLLYWLRYFCAFMLYMYGASKLLHFQFNLQSELAPRPIGSLNGYQLTWFYFGVSRVYACMVNILLINIFILVDDYGTYVISMLICISLLTVLWHQRRGLLTLLWSTQNGEPERSKRTHWWIRSSIVLIVASIIISVVVHQHRMLHS